MKCEIIRDLLPSYIDGLTSEESNQAIEEHLEGCRECRRYLEEMRKEIVTDKLAKDEIEKRKKEIQPLLKVRKVNLHKIFAAVMVTAMICAVLFGVYEAYYEYGRTADYSDVRITYEKVGNIVTLGFLPQNEKIYISAGVISVGEEEWLEIIKYRVSPFREPVRTGGYYRFTFIDEDTILDSDGKGTIDLTGNEEIKIHFADVTKTVNIKDLYTEKGITNSAN